MYTKHGQDPEILKLVHVDINQKWQSAVPSVEHLIYLELVSQKKQKLSIRLPFDKTDVPNYFTQRDWNKVVASVLRRTASTDDWFLKARKMDFGRGTRLGTLGYLPLDIRDQIWEYACRIDDKGDFYCDLNCLNSDCSGSKLIGFTEGFQMGPRGHGMRCCGEMELKKGTFRNLHTALGPTSVEIDRVFFSKHAFLFDCPQRLEKFLDFFDPNSSPALHVVARIFDERKSVRLSPQLYRYAYENRNRLSPQLCRCRYGNCDGDWLSTLACMPSIVRTVDFELGDRCARKFAGNGNNKDFRKMVVHFDFLNRAVMESNPSARTIISNERGWFGYLPGEQRAAFRAVLCPGAR